MSNQKKIDDWYENWHEKIMSVELSDNQQQAILWACKAIIAVQREGAEEQNADYYWEDLAILLNDIDHQ